MPTRRDQVVEMAYDLLSNPEGIHQLLDELDADYESNIKAQSGDAQAGVEGREGAVPLDLASVETHFEKAAALFQRYVAARGDGNAQEAPRPIEVMLDGRGRVLSEDAALCAALGLTPGGTICEAEMDADAAQMLRAWFDPVQTPPGARSFTLVPAYDGEGRRIHWALNPVFNSVLDPVPEARGASAAEPGAPGVPVAQLSLLSFGWSAQAGQAVVAAFGLTQSEQGILRAIVQGQSLADYAAQRGRSVETVRTQAKALLAKTGVTSQLELVRLFAAISLVAPESAEQPGPKEGEAATDLVPVGGGRSLEVLCFGPKTGRPVLMMHNVMAESLMVPCLYDALERAGMRLICPWRAGYATSSPLPKGADPLDQMVADTCAVLDHYGVARVQVVGMMVSVRQAARFAARSPERVSSLAVVSGYLPLRSAAQIDAMGRWPRIIAYSSRHFPHALRLILTGLMAMLNERKTEKIVERFYGHSPADLEFFEDPDARLRFAAAFRRAYLQDAGAIQQDFMLNAEDWSGELAALSMPVTYVHGTANGLTRIEDVEALVRDLGTVRLSALEGAGHLPLFYRTDEVLARLEAIEAEARAEQAGAA